ncbi:MAG: methionine gamma-lyase [Bacteroidetes bacterium HGW-Bacteroidetes-6]|jgi:methionine-gamma-lyase|nr:MAG: methionine gamma-lyase [Bacteroidetes bacterium HGW-Bacteroidetes-6]
MKNVDDLGMNTQLVHAGDFEDAFGSAVTPIYQTSTFAFRNAAHGADLFAGREKGFIYSRIGNPTIGALEDKLAVMENGFGAIACSSGMGAVSTVYLALLSKGDHIVSSNAVYGPSRNIMENHFVRWGIESSYVDTSDINVIREAIRPNTKVLYLETPANPTMTIVDIKAASDLAHQHGIIVVVDNTFCSPILQKPLDLGADISLHSLTKYINGHADIVGGALIAKTEEMYKKLRAIMVGFGFNMDPHQAYLVIRGAKTLALRVERAQENSIKVAEFLEAHPKIAWVKYPGLKSHPQYELAQQQMKGPGSMICFEMKGGYEAGVKLMNNVHLVMLAVSLGGVESLIQHPASMTHAGVSAEGKKTAFITEGLVRLSVGIEDVDDVIKDLEYALDQV